MKELKQAISELIEKSNNGQKSTEVRIDCQMLEDEIWEQFFGDKFLNALFCFLKKASAYFKNKGDVTVRLGKIGTRQATFIFRRRLQ